MTGELVRVRPGASAVARRRTPVPAVTTADMAWMAGVIDLKGAVVRKANKTRRTPQVVLYVNTKNARIAGRLSALTGTAPEPHAAMKSDEFIRRGCAEHCVTPHIHVGEYPWRMPETTRWSLTGIAAAVVLANLAPYMTTYDVYAGSVAEITVNFAAQGQGSGAVHGALSRLSQLGWQLPPLIESRLPPDWKQGVGE